MALDVGVVILAGGAAQRFPDKLTKTVGDVPLIVRVYRNVSPGRDTVISAKGAFAPEIDALLPVPMVVDRWNERSALNGLLSAMSEMSVPFVFAVGGDMPYVTSSLIDLLVRERRDGEEALVPHHDGGVEPLAALYDRVAFLREGIPVLHSPTPSLQRVIEQLAHRFIPVPDKHLFTNLNTEAEYRSALKELERR